MAFTYVVPINAKGWFVYIISHGSLTAQDKAFFMPWESFFIAASMQQSVAWVGAAQLCSEVFCYDARLLIGRDVTEQVLVEMRTEIVRYCDSNMKKAGKLPYILQQNYLPPHMELKLIIGQIRLNPWWNSAH